MQLRHVNPIGLADVPLLGRQGEPFDQEGRGCLKPGEVFDATAEQARQLLPQVGNYEPADGEAETLLAELMSTTVDTDADAEPVSTDGSAQEGDI